MFSIGTLSFLDTEILRNNNNLGYIRSKLNNSNDEYIVGKNKNLYQINIRNKSPIYKISFELLIDKQKLIDLIKLIDDLYSDRLYNFNPNKDIKTDLLYPYSNQSSLNEFCFIENYELTDSYFINGNIVYKCKLELIEI